MRFIQKVQQDFLNFHLLKAIHSESSAVGSVISLFLRDSLKDLGFIEVIEVIVRLIRDLYFPLVFEPKSEGQQSKLLIIIHLMLKPSLNYWLKESYK